MISMTGATRYEWLLKEEAQSKGRLLSSQDTDYRDPNFEIDVAEICLKQPMVCNPIRPRDVEAPVSQAVKREVVKKIRHYTLTHIFREFFPANVYNGLLMKLRVP